MKHFTKEQAFEIVSPKDLEGLNREEIYNLSLQWFAVMSDYCSEHAAESLKFYNRLNEGIKDKKFKDELNTDRKVELIGTMFRNLTSLIVVTVDLVDTVEAISDMFAQSIMLRDSQLMTHIRLRDDIIDICTSLLLTYGRCTKAIEAFREDNVGVATEEYSNVKS